MTVTAAATGIKGTSSIGAVDRLLASLPYSDVITKKGYAMGYANQSFVFMASTDGTMEARPMPIEKIGVRMHTDRSQKNASIGMADRKISPASRKTNSGGRIKL